MAMIVRYRANHVAPRSSLWLSANCSRRQALAKIPAMVIDIGIPHTRNPATPMNVQLDRNAEESPNAARTRSVSGDTRPTSRMKSVRGLAFSRFSRELIGRRTPRTSRAQLHAQTWSHQLWCGDVSTQEQPAGPDVSYHDCSGSLMLLRISPGQRRPCRWPCRFRLGAEHL